MDSNILYLHCFAGVSGDMYLAAMLNLGVPEVYLKQELEKLSLEDEFRLLVRKDSKQGIYGVRVDVEIKPKIDTHEPAHRDYKAIKSMIERSSLDTAVKQRAIDIFDVIAHAEAAIHNTSVDNVHFHEVGATDSIVDIVGSAICLEYLIEHFSISKIVSSTVELGSGFINCDHGRYPIPAPATSEILHGVPISTNGVKGEATTPTGAAILKASVTEFRDKLRGTIEKTAYGIGHRDTNLPNVLRAQVVVQEPKLSGKINKKAEQIKIEANIDDMSPEAFSPLYDLLFEAGANDVFIQQILMKKTRPAFLLNVLCSANKADAISNVIFNNSSTIGLRHTAYQKRFLKKQNKIIKTSVGEIRVKQVVQPDGFIRWKSEHDDIARTAQALGETYLSLKTRIDHEIFNLLMAQPAAHAEARDTQKVANEPNQSNA